MAFKYYYIFLLFVHTNARRFIDIVSVWPETLPKQIECACACARGVRGVRGVRGEWITTASKDSSTHQNCFDIVYLLYAVSEYLRSKRSFGLLCILWHVQSYALRWLCGSLEVIAPWKSLKCLLRMSFGNMQYSYLVRPPDNSRRKKNSVQKI